MNGKNEQKKAKQRSLAPIQPECMNINATMYKIR